MEYYTSLISGDLYRAYDYSPMDVDGQRCGGRWAGYAIKMDEMLAHYGIETN